MFKGKYWTRNFTLVVVHQEGDKYKGHGVCQSTEFNTRNKGSVIYWWNDKGDCIMIQGLVDDIRKYDLMSRVKPDSVEGHSIVRDCEDCVRDGKR